MPSFVVRIQHGPRSTAAGLRPLSQGVIDQRFRHRAIVQSLEPSCIVVGRRDGGVARGVPRRVVAVRTRQGPRDRADPVARACDRVRRRRRARLRQPVPTRVIGPAARHRAIGAAGDPVQEVVAVGPIGRARRRVRDPSDPKRIVKRQCLGPRVHDLADLSIGVVHARRGRPIAPGPPVDRSKRLVGRGTQDRHSIDCHARYLMVGIVPVHHGLPGRGGHGGEIRVQVAIGHRECDRPDGLALGDDPAQAIVAPGQGVIGIGSAGEMATAVRARIVGERDRLIRRPAQRVRRRGHSVQGVIGIGRHRPSGIGGRREVPAGVVGARRRPRIRARLGLKASETIVGTF